MKKSFPTRCDGLVRREALRIGGLTAFGMGLGSFFRIRNATAQIAKHKAASQSLKSCILIWLDGGPSHIETFDPKPDSPSEIRGPLAPISTAVPGISIGECLPETAKRMKDVAIIRSMTSTLGEHNFGTHYLMSGYKPNPSLEYASFHSVGASFYDQVSSLPKNIAIPNFRVGGSSFSGNGFLDKKFKPFSLNGDPSRPNFRVRDLDVYRGMTLDRIRNRKQFVNELNRFSNLASNSDDPAFDQAFRIMTSVEAKSAFQIDDEDQNTRKRYGPKSIGQCCLLARRLVERGVPFVTVNSKGWDTHADIATRLKLGFQGARQPVGLVPSLDLAFSALIDDLKDRGLFEQTLIVIMGEFGRTPKINTAGGRDHWPRVFSIAMAGGGISGGQVVGSSDAIGESPDTDPVTPSDLVATIYKIIGIDPHRELVTPDGRPVTVTPRESRIIPQLVS